MTGPVAGARPWLVLVVLVLGCSAVFDLVGLPSPVLFGSLAAGLVYALSVSRVPQVPTIAFTTGQALLGASIGVLFDAGTLAGLGDAWLPVIGVCVATLALSVLAGMVLQFGPGVSAATGAFAMVAGGASGIVAIARELGADDRVVAVVQYLRVLIIMLGMPVIAQAISSAGSAEPDTVLFESGPEAGPAVDVLVTVVCVVVGLLLARWIEIPAGSLLFPLFTAVVISFIGVGGTLSVPAALLNLGYALIGLQVGLRFTRASLKAVAHLLPLAVAVILGLMVACAGLGVVLARATGQSQLDGYLATTPGGLYAVLAAAVDSGSDVTFVLAVQILRLFVMLLGAPLLARRLRS